MAIDIVCPECGTDEHLRGLTREDDTIELTCDACETTWVRDPSPSCPKCGGRDMEAAPKVIVEKSRGSQMSIQGIQREFLCRVCDIDLILARRDGYLPDRLPGSQ
jgi:ssDNA-binding Zn-finger/Zn-ribbon topoisomerase 1